MKASGVNGQVELTETGITITRKGILGFMTQGLKGDKRIPFASIVAVQFKDASIVTNGYIQFSLLGGVEALGGIFNATQDENTVMFRRGKQAKVFNDLRNEVEVRITTARNPVVQQTPFSVADELQKLASLKDQGILSPSEFDQQKAAILARS